MFMTEHASSIDVEDSLESQSVYTTVMSSRVHSRRDFEFDDSTSLVSAIDDVLRDCSPDSPPWVVGEFRGHSSSAPWRDRLRRLARRAQVGGASDGDVPRRRDFEYARVLLEGVHISGAWRIGVMPDGEGGIEIHLVNSETRAHLSLVVSATEHSLTRVDQRGTTTVDLIDVADAVTRLDRELG